MTFPPSWNFITHCFVIIHMYTFKHYLNLWRYPAHKVFCVWRTSSILFFETRSLTGPRVYRLIRLLTREHWGSTCLCHCPPPNSRVIDMCYHRGAGDPNSGPHTVQQAPYHSLSTTIHWLYNGNKHKVPTVLKEIFSLGARNFRTKRKVKNAFALRFFFKLILWT